MRSKVVYCQRLDNDRFFVGLKVSESRIPWSILRRFDGIDIVDFAGIDIVQCKFCRSDKQKRFTVEMAIHLADIDKPRVFVFPELLVCQHCGKGEFTIPEDRLRLLMK